MDNYRDKGTFWLMDHAHGVAFNLSDGNPVAATAILTLIENIKGARAFGNMQIDLSPEEWDKLYHLCNEDPELLSSNIIAINMIRSYNNNAAAIVHKNLKFASPALFTEKVMEDAHGLCGNALFKAAKQCNDDFMSRYSVAKRHQPR